MKYQYRRERSDFWIIVHYNDDESYNISTGNKYADIIDFFFPMLEKESPTGWKHSEHNNKMSNLWIPEGCYNQSTMNHFLEWCEEITQEVLWLYLGKNISDYFSNELDLCISADFNFIYGNGRTEIGEAEYQLKYNASNLTSDQCNMYFGIIMNKMLDNCKYLPIANEANCLISPIPAIAQEKSKLAWTIANEMADNMGILFIEPTLISAKPQMKQLSVKDRIQTWRNIYAQNGVQIDKNVIGRDVIIVDDLYQSGTTMWQYASFLKENGARNVFGIVCVKSLKDSDNI